MYVMYFVVYTGKNSAVWTPTFSKQRPNSARIL